MAVPVRRNPLDMSGLDPVAQLERLHAQMGSLLDTWGPWSPIPELPTTGFVPRTDFVVPAISAASNASR